MSPHEIELLKQRLIIQPQEYRGMEPQDVKKKNDQQFCKCFFGNANTDNGYISSLFDTSIATQNEMELDYLLLLLEHFGITKLFTIQLAPLLVQPWHHMHDTLARLLMQCADPQTARHLFQGSSYYCENLEYQSDYGEFNRKCMHGLKNINTDESIHFLRLLATHESSIIKKLAQEILELPTKNAYAGDEGKDFQQNTFYNAVLEYHAKGNLYNKLSKKGAKKIEIVLQQTSHQDSLFAFFQYRKTQVMFEFKPESFGYSRCFIKKRNGEPEHVTNLKPYDPNLTVEVFFDLVFEDMDKDLKQ